MNQGLYEELVTKLINYKLNELDKDTFQVKKTQLIKQKQLNYHNILVEL
jgi:hypothetical protein